jgi:hypothetical protein
MFCREELETEENGVGEERLLRMRLARIADMWLYRQTVKYNK